MYFQLMSILNVYFIDHCFFTYLQPKFEKALSASDSEAEIRKSLSAICAIFLNVSASKVFFYVTSINRSLISTRCLRIMVKKIIV